MQASKERFVWGQTLIQFWKISQNRTNSYNRSLSDLDKTIPYKSYLTNLKLYVVSQIASRNTETYDIFDYVNLQQFGRKWSLKPLF